MGAQGVTIKTALEYRSEFVQSLMDQGSIRSERVKAAFLNVERHRFVRGWFAMGISEGMPVWTRITINPLNPQSEHLEVIYSTQSLVSALDSIIPIGSLSAPPLVAQMLEYLSANRGMNVLEIGTCSGYNAALLAEIVSSDGTVHSIENRTDAADSAAVTLRQLGYVQAHVHSRDGFFGDSQNAPYDRMIATAGCSDLSPHWIEQLQPDGQMVIPLQYGQIDYLVLASRDNHRVGAAIGKIVGKSSFMPIQGILSWANPWGSWISPGIATITFQEQSLPEELPQNDTKTHPIKNPVHSDFYYFLTLASRDLWYCNQGYGLADPMTRARAIVTNDSFRAFGPPGAEEAGCRLIERLVEIHTQWRDVGCPSPGDYQIEFIPKHLSHSPPFISITPRWVIERVFHLEIISL
ncbi:hypothetical protein KAJ02_04415 [Candidatus Bipolaricaulota bacterium]|nr:hypothetical protein [Candidatus Bipolaricaulota bacterium]